MRMLFAVIFALMLGGAAADAKVSITIDKSRQRISVSADGRQLYNWPVSTGRAGRDTPGGEYRAFRMEKDHYSKEWDDAPMPNSIFFTRAGHAIHGTFDTKKIGSPASAGCVRLAPENAEVLFALVEDHGVLNTTVKVTGDLSVALARTRPQRATARAAAEDAAAARRPRAAPRRDYYVEHYPVNPYAFRPAPYEPPPPPPGYSYGREPYPRYYRW